MMKKIISIVFVIISFFSCKNGSNLEKYPNFSKNIVDISKDIVNFETDLLLGQSELKIVGEYLLVCDIFSTDEGFYFYDKEKLTYEGSGGKKGQGPGEIINYGNINIIPNEDDHSSFLYMTILS